MTEYPDHDIPIHLVSRHICQEYDYLYDNVPDRLIIGLSLAPYFDPIDHKRGNIANTI